MKQEKQESHIVIGVACKNICSLHRLCLYFNHTWMLFKRAKTQLLKKWPSHVKIVYLFVYLSNYLV